MKRISISKRKNKTDINNFLLPLKNDKFDTYRKEYNNIIMSFDEKISQKENELILGETGGGMGFTHKIEQIKNSDKHVN